MNKSILPAAIGIILIASIGSITYAMSFTSSSAGTETRLPPDTTTSRSLADIAEHKDETSCWTAINGKAYDLTDWVNQHPGGQAAILSICGKDGSAAFNGQHGGAEQQQQILATYQIGVLSK